MMMCEYLVMMCFLIICFFSLLSSSKNRFEEKKKAENRSIAQKFSLEKTVGKHNKNFFYGKNTIITR